MRLSDHLNYDDYTSEPERAEQGYSYEDYQTNGLIVVNAFDDNIKYNTDYIDLEKELSLLNIEDSLTIKEEDGIKTVYSSSVPITLRIRGNTIIPELGSKARLKIKGTSKKALLMMLVKHSEETPLYIDQDRWESYIITWNQKPYEIGFNKDNNWSYMKRYDRKKFSNMYYRELYKEHKSTLSTIKANDGRNEIYGDADISLGWLYISKETEKIDEAISVIIDSMNSVSPAVQSYAKMMIESIVECKDNDDKEV